MLFVSCVALAAVLEHLGLEWTPYCLDDGVFDAKGSTKVLGTSCS